MKLFMLDTDTCSYIIREKPASVLEHFSKLQINQICISAVTYGELLYGVARSSSTKVNRPIIDAFIRHLDVMTWGEAAAGHFGDVRTELEAAGTPIGAMDMLIAAHARSLHATLVTNNARRFSRVKGLKAENWV